MKKNLFRILTTLTLSLWSWVSFAQKNEALALIPRNSGKVQAIYFNRIGAKLDLKALGNLRMVREIQKSAAKKGGGGEKIMQYFAQPSKMGIDFGQPIFMTTDAEGRANIYFTLSSKSAFRKMMGEIVKDAGKNNASEAAKMRFSKKKGIQILETQSFQAGMKGNVVILSMPESPNDGLKKLANRQKSGISTEDTPPPPADMVQLFNLKPSENVMNDLTFQRAYNGTEQHDIITWGNFGNSMATAARQVPQIGMLFDDEALQKSYSLGFTDFLNGKVVSRSEINLDQSLKDKISPYFKANITNNFSPFLTHPNHIGSMSLALNMAKVGEGLAGSGLENFMPTVGADSTKKAGEKPEFLEFLSAFEGDLIISMFADSGKISPVLALQLRDKTKLLGMLNRADIQQQMRMSPLADPLKRTVFAIAPKPKPAEVEVTEDLEVPPPPPMQDGESEDDATMAPPADLDTVVVGTAVEEGVTKEEKTEEVTEIEAAPAAESDVQSDIEYTPPPKKKTKMPFNFNRLVVQGDMLILTDSLAMNSVLGFTGTPTTLSERTQAMLGSQFGMTFNVTNLMNAIPQAKGLEMLMGKMPISDFQITMKGKLTNMVVTSPKANENIIMTLAKSIDRILGFVMPNTEDGGEGSGDE